MTLDEYYHYLVGENILEKAQEQVAEIQEMVEYKEWGDEINPQNNSLKVKN